MFKPLLASALDPKNLAIKYPVLVSPKLDGIRCVVLNGKAVSRNLKPIQNDYVRMTIESSKAHGCNLDGELMAGDSFQAVSSAIMSHDGEPKFTYFVFDIPTGETPFAERLAVLKTTVERFKLPWLKLVPHVVVNTDAELLAFEQKCLAQGYEGVMIRSVDGRYKNGRSTINEGILLKLKRFADAEAVVTGSEPLYTNQNEAVKDALGHTKRSSAKEGKVALDTLGSLSVKWNGIEFNIGTGFDSLTRAALWSDRKALVGKTVKFKYQDTGVKEAPRFPVFLGFRDKADL